MGVATITCRRPRAAGLFRECLWQTNSGDELSLSSLLVVPLIVPDQLLALSAIFDAPYTACDASNISLSAFEIHSWPHLAARAWSILFLISAEFLYKACIARMPRRNLLSSTPVRASSNISFTDASLLPPSDSTYATNISTLRRQWRWAAFSQFFYTFAQLLQMPDVLLTVSILSCGTELKTLPLVYSCSWLPRVGHRGRSCTRNRHISPSNYAQIIVHHVTRQKIDVRIYVFSATCKSSLLCLASITGKQHFASNVRSVA